MTECEACPVVTRFKILENSVEDLKSDVKQIRGEVKENEKAWSKLSSDLVIHMHNSESRSKEIYTLVKNLDASFKKHMEDEEGSVRDLKNSIDSFKNELFNPKDGVFTKMKESLAENKFKTIFMWSFGGFSFTVATGILVYIFKETILK